MEKLLPQNIEAESGVLGSIIIDPEAIVQVADFLRAEDFYRDAHRTIYEIIIQLYEQHEPADFITICDELERINRLEDVGGASYITSLINQVPTSGNVEYYGRIVERTAILRRLIHAAGQIAAVAYEEADAEIALDKAEQLIFEISQRHSHADFSALRDLLSDYMEKLEQLHERRGAIVGVPTGFTDLDRLTGGLQRSDLIILAARPAVGKCVTSWTLIDDPATGERMTIEECIQRRLPEIHSLSEGGKVHVASVGDWIDSGIKPCYRVRTHSGRSVDVTGHHPFLTVKGWIPLHDLEVGQSIAVPGAVPAFGTDESWPLEKVRLLAYFIAEGGLTNTSPMFTNTDPVIIEDFRQAIATHFPTCDLRRERITYTVAQRKGEYTKRGIALLPANPATVWLRELGLMGKLARDKSFPTCVWKWSRRHLAEFLRALMSCDGSIYATESGKPRIEFTVASCQLAADLHHALIRFGIHAKYCKSSPDAWRVNITNPESIKTYQQEIGWIGEKDRHHHVGTRLCLLTNEPANRIEARLIGAFPDLSAWETWGDIPDKSGKAPINRASIIYDDFSNSVIVSDGLARRPANTHEQSEATTNTSPDIYWDKIVSIEPIGEHHVYDLTVPDGANFVAQDIFVHNTSFALSLAHNAALKYQKGVIVFSLEMSKEQLLQRILSMDASVDQQRLRTGWIEDDEWERIIDSMGRLAEANIFIDDTAGITTMEMRSKARRLVAEHGVDMIIVDYLQLMQSDMGGGKRNENRVQEVSEISRNLKGLARELNVPVLALAQLSRTVESRQSKVPQLSDLRESGCLAGETPVYLPDEGVYRPIAELVGEQGFRVLALNTETWQLEPRKVTNAFATGHKPVYKITTRLGRTIRATANHKFLTIHGWKRLDELQKEERIAQLLPGGTAENLADSRRGSALCLSASSVSSLECGPDRHKTLSLREENGQPGSDVYWDQILTIEPDGEEGVYDLTIEGLHNFVAGDVVVHNSIEQDADIVMFIYRDEVYNPETERKNIADIIIAKHRNGPVGEVSLFFQANQTRFADLEVSPPVEEE